MADLAEIIEKYRKGRDGFDALALRSTQLYLSGALLPALDEGEEKPILDRVLALSSADLESALDGDLGTVPMTRDEYQSLLSDILDFLKEWISSDPNLL